MQYVFDRSGIQAGEFSTLTLLLKSHAVVIHAEVRHCLVKICKTFSDKDVV